MIYKMLHVRSSKIQVCQTKDISGWVHESVKIFQKSDSIYDWMSHKLFPPRCSTVTYVWHTVQELYGTDAGTMHRCSIVAVHINKGTLEYC